MKVKNFINSKYKEIENIVKNSENKIDELPKSEETDYSEINEQLSNATNDILELDTFMRLNSLGFTKVFK